MKIGKLRTVTFYFGTHEVSWSYAGEGIIHGRVCKNTYHVCISPGNYNFKVDHHPTITASIRLIKKIK